MIMSEILRGGIKNCFFYYRSKRGGGLGQLKKSLSENIQIFFDHFDQKLSLFTIFDQKLSFFFTIFDQKLSFFTIFFMKGGWGLTQSTKSLSEKTEVVKKREGGSQFFY